MQSYALTVDKFLDHAAKWWGDREIVTAERGRIGYAALRDAQQSAVGRADALGLKFGDRVGTLAWNTQHHLEIYYGAMGAGLVCHTLNPRLTVAHLAAMVNEARGPRAGGGRGACAIWRRARARIVRASRPWCFWTARSRSRAPSATAGRSPSKRCSPNLAPKQHGASSTKRRRRGFATHPARRARPRACSTPIAPTIFTRCARLQADAIALTRGRLRARGRADVSCQWLGFSLRRRRPSAPSWCCPAAIPMARRLARLIRDEGVTVAAGVQTVWQGLLDHLDATGGDVPIARARDHRRLHAVRMR